MTTRELQELLLTHYLFAVEMVEDVDSYEEANELLWIMGVGDGLCPCAARVFSIDTDEMAWVCKYKREGSFYWGYIPKTSNTKKEMTERLMIRVNNLQKELALS
jgi:hypothetical protein